MGVGTHILIVMIVERTGWAVGRSESERLVRSKQRVADHGEVFTPAWMVEDMLNLVREESERIDSRFLGAFHPDWTHARDSCAMAA